MSGERRAKSIDLVPSAKGSTVLVTVDSRQLREDKKYGSLPSEVLAEKEALVPCSKATSSALWL